jgi:hypothetical protein
MIYKQSTEENKRTSFNFMLSPAERKKLQELADTNGLSMAGCLRLLIIEAHKYIGTKERTI